jgi:hypothetical protein
VLSFRRVSDATLNSPTPQFGTAEYVGTPGDDHCQFCHQPITGSYYRVNEAVACLGCAEKARSELAKDTHPAYMRGFLYGIGAAIVGMILYATVAITTGIISGYVSLAVGWMVGKAILKGSGGEGGRRYQITAAVLTYCAVSMAAVPIWFHYAGEQKHAQTREQQEQRQQLDAQRQKNQQPSDEEFVRQEEKVNPNLNPSVNQRANQRANPNVSVARPSFGKALVMLALTGIASPFIEIWEGGPSFGAIIGIVILIVGIRIAWRITAGRPLEIYGPFENSAQPVR